MSLPERNNLETAFACIQSGNELESNEKHWEAAVQFDRAHQILGSLLAAPNNDPKIAELYQQQTREYFFRSREALLTAMRRENDQDQQQDSTETLIRSNLENEDAQTRLTLFGSLYAHIPKINESSANLSEISLQTRLMQLNESLPQGFKTNDQRMAEINRGLNRLGLSSINTSNDNQPSSALYSVTTTKSESEQVDEIIAQAKDEIRFTAATSDILAGGPSIVATTDATPDAVDDSDESDTDEHDSDDKDDDKGEIELTAEQIVSIREQVVEAQAELAQLIALLEADEGGDSEIEFEPLAGMANLSKARSALRRAAIEWKKPA